MNRKFPRSLFPKTKRTANALCGYKPHFKGVVREVVGYHENLLAKYPDDERFVWYEFETLRAACHRFSDAPKEEGKPKPKGKGYSERAVKYALKYLRRKYIISRRVKRYRRGALREGVILAPHDAVFAHTGKLCEYVGRKVPKVHWLRDEQTKSWYWVPSFVSQVARLTAEQRKDDEQ
jgi:hypothetical protein